MGYELDWCVDVTFWDTKRLCVTKGYSDPRSIQKMCLQSSIYITNNPALEFVILHNCPFIRVVHLHFCKDFFLVLILRTMLEHALTSLSWDILSTISARHVQRWGKKLTLLNRI